MEIVPQKVEELRRYVGAASFVPCNGGVGGKAPIIPRWQNLQLANMTSRHIAQCERDGYRIGVVLGSNSGGLCAIACDDEAFADSMLKLNPWLGRTLTTKCNRDVTFWLRISGGHPKTCRFYVRGDAVPAHSSLSCWGSVGMGRLSLAPC